LANGGVACVGPWVHTYTTITSASQVQCVPKRNGGSSYRCPGHLPQMCRPFDALPSCPQSIFDGFCNPQDLRDGGVACVGNDVTAYTTITGAAQVECVPARNGGSSYQCPGNLPQKCLPPSPSGTFGLNFHVETVETLPACPKSIFDGFCSKTDLANGGVACVGPWANSDTTITGASQVQCVPKQNGGSSYHCPSNLPQMCQPFDALPSCPQSIFDGFCNPQDLREGGVACVGSGFTTDTTITSASQVQCVPEKNGGASYACPSNLPQKCKPQTQSSVYGNNFMVQTLPTCPQSIFNGFCSKESLADGGVACVGYYASVDTTITSADQVQCVPKKNGGSSSHCPSTLPQMCQPFSAPTPISPALPACPKSIFDGFCSQEQLRDGGVACVGYYSTADTPITSASEVQCVP